MDEIIVVIEGLEAELIEVGDFEGWSHQDYTGNVFIDARVEIKSKKILIEGRFKMFEPDGISMKEASERIRELFKC